MKHPHPEFSRPIEALRIPPGGSTERLSAEPGECAAVARRLEVPALRALSGVLKVMPWRAGGLHVKGQLVADIDQTCVVSLETFRAVVTKPVDRYFLPPAVLKEMDEDEADADALEDGKADLGELVTETLALELDPYPRKPGAVFAPADAPAAEEPASPFASLAKLTVGQRRESGP